MNFCGYRIDTACRNCIVRERTSNNASIYILRRIGIVNLVRKDRSAERIATDLIPENLAEVPIPHRAGWHGSEVSSRVHGIAIHLEIEQEECFIAAIVEFGNPDRTADGAAEIVLAAARIGVSERSN